MKSRLMFFHLIDGTDVMGDAEGVTTEAGQNEILIKEPYTAKAGNILPYMADILTEPVKAIRVHPMNVMWQVPLDEFEQVEEVYKKATSKIVTQEKKIIL